MTVFMTSDANPTIRRAADLRASSFNAEKRTVDAVVSTGASVQRRDSRGPYVERLDLSAINPKHLEGLPVLDSHRQGSVRDVIGVIQSARFEDGALVATIRLSVRADVDAVAEDIQSGVLRGMSIGYAVDRWSEGTDPSTGARTRTATAWTIKEISFVSVPADPGATVRSETMPQLTVNPPPLETPMPAPVPDDVKRTRAEIRTIARSAGLSTEWAEAQIDSGADITVVRAAAFTEMQNRSATPIRTQVGVDHTDPTAIVTRMGDALFARVNGTAPPDNARQFMGDRLVDMAKSILTMRGVSTNGMQPEELLRAAQHTTSDFPNLLTGVGNRTLLAAYEAAPNPLKALARRATRPDFRPGSSLRLGEVGKLKPVSESGEIKHTSRAEAVESYSLDTYGSIFSLSRKAIINDDLGAFRDWSVAAGRACAETEAGQVIDLLAQGSGAGPVMGDGVRLFHTSHGNLATTPGEPSVESLSAARLAMRNQKGVDGVTPINATPKFLVVAPDLETIAEQVLASLTPHEVGEVNPFSGKLSLMVEARLPGDAWFLFADPAVLPVLELAYLTSAPGPQMASREGWDVLGMEFRVTLDVGVGAIDWRGAHRTPANT